MTLIRSPSLLSFLSFSLFPSLLFSLSFYLFPSLFSLFLPFPFSFLFSLFHLFIFLLLFVLSHFFSSFISSPFTFLSISLPSLPLYPLFSIYRSDPEVINRYKIQIQAECNGTVKLCDQEEFEFKSSLLTALEIGTLSLYILSLIFVSFFSFFSFFSLIHSFFLSPLFSYSHIHTPKYIYIHTYIYIYRRRWRRRDVFT